MRKVDKPNYERFGAGWDTKEISVYLYGRIVKRDAVMDLNNWCVLC